MAQRLRLTLERDPRWADRRRIAWAVHQPGKPGQNALTKNFNVPLRDELLNETLFRSLGEARRLIEAWRHDFNRHRPHSKLVSLTPNQQRSTLGAFDDDHTPVDPGQAPRSHHHHSIFQHVPQTEVNDLTEDAHIRHLSVLRGTRSELRFQHP